MPLERAGDTIVEVLISIAIIGVVLGGAYVTINRDSDSFIDTSERAQAVKLVESQIEALRADPSYSQSSGCFYYNSATASDSPETGNDCTVQSDGSVATPTSQPAYTLTITPSLVEPITYTVAATWHSAITSTTEANVTMEYRSDEL
jgi:type II secretory pathway pseudopilin PulG